MALIVIEVFMAPGGMPSMSVRMWPRWATGTPTLPTSPRASGMVGVVPGLGGQVEGDRQARSGPWPGWCGRARSRPRPSSAPSRCASATACRPSAQSAPIPARGTTPPAARSVTARHGGGSESAAGRPDGSGEMAGQIVASGTTFGRHDVGCQVRHHPPDGDRSPRGHKGLPRGHGVTGHAGHPNGSLAVSPSASARRVRYSCRLTATAPSVAR